MIYKLYQLLVSDWDPKVTISKYALRFLKKVLYKKIVTLWWSPQVTNYLQVLLGWLRQGGSAMDEEIFVHVAIFYLSCNGYIPTLGKDLLNWFLGVK